MKRGRSVLWGRPSFSVVCLLAVFFGACGYSDFRLPELPRAEPRIHYEWDIREAPVITPGAPGDWDSHDALNPSVVRRGDHYYNFYSGFDGHTWRTGLATSADGLAWQKHGPLLSPDPQLGEDNYIAANGAALFYRGEFRVWYQAGPKDTPRLGFAQSPDALHWRKSRFPVIDFGPRGSWDERGIADPYCIPLGGYTYLFYTGQDRARRQRLGLARSLDGLHWQKLRSNPILELGEYGGFDEMALGEPAVWIAHGYYWMLYTGRDARQIRRLGFARSTDGVHWDKLPPVLGNAAWYSKVLCDPTIEILGGRLAVWFGGGDIASPDENLHGQIGVATLRAVADDHNK